MKYPRFLKEHNVLGVTAISSGTGSDIKEVKIALNNLKKTGFRLIVTPNVYGEKIVSSSVERRIDEFNSLLDEDINILMNIRGGDFSLEVINKLNLKKIVDKRILVEGFSDITSLVYVLTTKYDFVTLYGLNVKCFDDEILKKYQLNNIAFLTGKMFEQSSFMDRKTISLNGDFTASGILIGGCLDVIRFIIGTNLDNTMNFIQKYHDKKIIWYFDIFAMGSVDVYLTLLQMQRIGWFKYTDTLLFGSVIYPKVECEMEYIDAFLKLFPDKNIIVDANIGHVFPSWAMVNGSMATVIYQKDKVILRQELMDENNG